MELGTRVKIMTGDGVTFMGEGNYIGDTTVYAILKKSGDIQSLLNAETKPDHSVLEEGDELLEIKDNPKFEMDDGRTVYGCQVWFKPIPPPTVRMN